MISLGVATHKMTGLTNLRDPGLEANPGEAKKLARRRCLCDENSLGKVEPGGRGEAGWQNPRGGTAAPCFAEHKGRGGK